MPNSYLENLIASFDKYEDKINFEELTENQKLDVSNDRNLIILIISDIIQNRVEFRVLRHSYYLFLLTSNNNTLIESINQNLTNELISGSDLFNIINQHLISQNVPRPRVETDSLIREFTSKGILNEKIEEHETYYNVNTFAKEGKFYFSSTTISRPLNENPRVVYSSLRNLKQKKLSASTNLALIESKRSENRKGSEYYAIAHDGIILYKFLESRFHFDENFWKELNNSCSNLLILIEKISNLSTKIKNSKESFKKLTERFKSILGKSIKEWKNDFDTIEVSNTLQELLIEILKYYEYSSLNYRILTSMQDELGTIALKLKSSLKRFNNNPDIKAIHDVIRQFEEQTETYNNPIAISLPIFLENFLAEPELSELNSELSIDDLLNSNMFNELLNDEKYIYNNINIFENSLREEDLF